MTSIMKLAIKHDFCHVPSLSHPPTQCCLFTFLLHLIIFLEYLVYLLFQDLSSFSSFIFFSRSPLPSDEKSKGLSTLHSSPSYTLNLFLFLIFIPLLTLLHNGRGGHLLCTICVFPQLTLLNNGRGG